jgi:hypothetical protein
MKYLSNHNDLTYELLTSLLIRGIHMGEISRLGSLIGLIKHAIRGIGPFDMFNQPDHPTKLNCITTSVILVYKNQFIVFIY